MPKRDLVIVALISLLGSALVLRHLEGAAVDDAWITYRYAENLLDGHGWRYNLSGHTSDAASAPLYTTVLAGLAVLTRSVPRAGSVLFVLSTAAEGTLGYALLKCEGRRLSGVVAAVLIVTSPWLAVTRGMETPMLLALSLACVMAARSGHGVLTGALAVLVVATRADGFIVAVVAIVSLVAAHRAQLTSTIKRLAIGLLAVGLPWLAWSYLVIGSVVPDTAGAKAAQGRSGFWGPGLLFAHGVIDIPKAFGFSGWTVCIAAAAAVGGLLLGVRRFRHGLVEVCVAAALVFAVYALVIRPPDYHWYYGMPVLAVCLLAGSGIGAIADIADIASHAHHAHHAGGRPQGNTARAMVASAVAVSSVLTAAIAATGWRQTPQGFGPQDYVAASAWLQANTRPTARIAASEIGILGWFSRRPMVDYLGLLSKQSVKDLDNHDLTSWLAREQPDIWLVHQPVWGMEQPAAEQPWFSLAYRPVWDQGTLVAWAKAEPVPVAQEAAATTLTRLTASVTARLPASSVPPALSQPAVTSLLAAVASRPVLARRFLSPDGALRLGALLSWAAGDGSTSDEGAAALAAYAPTYSQLSLAVPATETLPALGRRVATAARPTP